MQEYNFRDRVDEEEIKRVYKLVKKHKELISIINDLPIWIIILNKEDKQFIIIKSYQMI